MSSLLRYQVIVSETRVRIDSVKGHDPNKLLFGPYHPPKTRPGRRLFCEILGTVIVGRFRDGQIPWPCTHGRKTPIVCGDFFRALKSESRTAVAHHFGVCESLVTRYRKILGIPKLTPGTVKLYSRIAGTRTDDRLVRARANSKKPSALRKASVSLKGRIQSPTTIEAVRKAAQRPRSEAWKNKMAKYWRQRGHPPGHPDYRFWTKQEDAILGTASDPEIARRLKRSVKAVSARRWVLKVPGFQRRWVRERQ